MIKNFSDHAANERTFLAWVRTAITVMAFGFLVEKFDLFLRYMGLSIGAHAPHPPPRAFGALAGLSLIILGMLMMVVATVRFLQIARNIDVAEQHLAAGSKLDIALAVLLTLLGASLFAYLAQRLFTGF